MNLVVTDNDELSASTVKNLIQIIPEFPSTKILPTIMILLIYIIISAKKKPERKHAKVKPN